MWRPRLPPQAGPPQTSPGPDLPGSSRDQQWSTWSPNSRLTNGRRYTPCSNTTKLSRPASNAPDTVTNFLTRTVGTHPLHMQSKGQRRRAIDRTRYRENWSVSLNSRLRELCLRESPPFRITQANSDLTVWNCFFGRTAVSL